MSSRVQISLHLKISVTLTSKLAGKLATLAGYLHLNMDPAGDKLVHLRQ